jgi:hypothetical protein
VPTFGELTNNYDHHASQEV